MPKFIVIAGNPVEGLLYYGPFDSFDAACNFNSDPEDHEWWVAELISPEDTAERVLPRLNRKPVA